MVFFYNWKFYLDNGYSIYYIYPGLAIYVIITFCLLPFVNQCAKREWWPLLIIWLIYGGGLVVFALFAIVQNIGFEFASPFQKRIFVGVLASFFIIWKIIVLIMTIITMFGFRQGLKDKFYPPQDSDYELPTTSTRTTRNDMQQSTSAFD